MELVYKGKIKEKEILKRAKSFGGFKEYNFDKSLLIHGDNFEALSKLLNTKRESIDLIYIDPPFNTNQSFAISEGRANAISRSKKGKTAYEDLMKPEEFVEFLRERLILMRELLSNKGSIYVHIDTKMGHYLKIVMDEVFGNDNFKNDITRIKSNPKNFSRKAYGNQKDMILFYTKNKDKNIWNDITIKYSPEELNDKFKKIDEKGRRYNTIPLHAPGETKGVTGQKWRGMFPPEGRHWRTDPVKFDEMDAKGLIEWSKNGNPRIKRFADEHKGKKIQDLWIFKDPQKPLYPTQKNSEMLDLIIKQSSEENSIVMDCFSGSGSTLCSAEKNHRIWIGIDRSDMAIKVINSRKKELGPFIYKELLK